jgi:ribose/xylose/arabinose/galactoside ABC-type transport system permease subunit
MSTRTRWLLVVTLGLMAHLLGINIVVAKLSPFYNLPSYTTGLPPYGQVNFQTADSIAFIVQLVVVACWLAFAVSLLRDKSG